LAFVSCFAFKNLAGFSGALGSDQRYAKLTVKELPRVLSQGIAIASPISNSLPPGHFRLSADVVRDYAPFDCHLRHGLRAHKKF
jgi:hypothetical protein